MFSDLERSRTKINKDRIGKYSKHDGRAPSAASDDGSYSLAMLFREATSAAKSNLLQLFASDIDADAIASAREGFYPKAIEAEVSPDRLARFFVKEDHAYRVSPELRASVVFTVQDVLPDPPFSRWFRAATS